MYITAAAIDMGLLLQIKDAISIYHKINQKIMKKGNAFVVQSNRLKKPINTKINSSSGERTAQMICPLKSNFESRKCVIQ